MDLKDPDLYRQWCGITQSSADKTLSLSSDGQVCRMYRMEGDKKVLVLTFSESNLREWSPHKILNKAGVAIDEQAGKY